MDNGDSGSNDFQSLEFNELPNLIVVGHND
jgi:hypothetical protein